MKEGREPEWLTWVRQLQSIAQAGLTYSKSKYELDRCRQILEIAAEMAASQTDSSKEKVREFFDLEHGYVTPKVDVRGAVFKDGCILMVRETIDANKWTLPGGWADVGISASENVAKEVFEESGFTVEVKKLAMVSDRSKHTSVPHPNYIYKLFFICAVLGGGVTPSYETSEVKWFAEHELPQEKEMSVGRAPLRHVKRMFEHFRNPALPTDFD